PDLDIAGTKTNAVCGLIASGVARDVSVGFSPGHFECSICRGDPYDWFSGTCRHIPGLKYSGKGDVVTSGGTLCYAWVCDAKLREVSLVYLGATPGAQVTDLAIEKARRMRDSLALTPREF